MRSLPVRVLGRFVLKQHCDSLAMRVAFVKDIVLLLGIMAIAWGMFGVSPMMGLVMALILHPVNIFFMGEWCTTWQLLCRDGLRETFAQRAQACRMGKVALVWRLLTLLPPVLLLVVVGTHAIAWMGLWMPHHAYGWMMDWQLLWGGGSIMAFLCIKPRGIILGQGEDSQWEVVAFKSRSSLENKIKEGRCVDSFSGEVYSTAIMVDASAWVTWPHRHEVMAVSIEGGLAKSYVHT